MQAQTSICSSKAVKGDVFKFSAVIGDRRVNAFMAAADLRDPSKVFATQINFYATADGTKTIREMFDALRVALAKEYHLVQLVLIGKTNADGEFVGLTYCDENVKEVSDGKKSYFVG